MNSNEQQQLIRLAATPFDGRYEYYTFAQLSGVYNQLGSIGRLSNSPRAHAGAASPL